MEKTLEAPLYDQFYEKPGLTSLQASAEANCNLLRKRLGKVDRKLPIELNQLEYERSALTDEVKRSAHLPLVWRCVSPCGLGQTPAREVPTMRTTAVCAESCQEPELSSAPMPTEKAARPMAKNGEVVLAILSQTTSLTDEASNTL